MKSIKATREEVVVEARSWVGTPYRLGGRVKGSGADCATLIYMTYLNCGLIPEQEIGIFSQDWWLHTPDEKYLFRIIRHAAKLAEAQCFPSLKLDAGNIILTKAAGSRVYNHGAIVTEWPMVVHALNPAVEEVNATRHPMWTCQGIAVFDPWGSVPAVEPEGSLQ